MTIALRALSELPEELPSSLLIAGKSVPIRAHNETILMAELPDGISGSQLVTMLSMMFAIHVVELQSVPGEFKVEVQEVHHDMDRLMEEQEKELQQLRSIPEPIAEISPNDPLLDTMVPTGKKIWDSVFVKHTPVANLQQWLLTKDADDYIYLPNDASKMAWEAEQFTSNAMYTEVLVNAYNLLCIRNKLNPKARLVNGLTVNLNGLTPLQGSQHTVPGENAARLANSKLIDFDDSEYAVEFIECICDLTPDQYENDSVRRRVLAKAEYILMGRTSHTYNQRFIHALYNRFVIEIEPDDPWANHRVALTNCLLSILKQMVFEGLVLEDNKEMFLNKVKSMGFGEFTEAIGVIYDKCGGGIRG